MLPLHLLSVLVLLQLSMASGVRELPRSHFRFLLNGIKHCDANVAYEISIEIIKFYDFDNAKGCDVVG